MAYGAGKTPSMARPLRFYVEHEQMILGAAAVVAFLLFWEGLSRGWWSDLLAPALGGGAERFHIKPIFISSPGRIATTFYRLAFATGELWNDLWVSAYEYVLGFLLAVAVGLPLGMAAGWYKKLYFAVEPFLSALNATPQIAFLPLIIVWAGVGLLSKVVVIFLLAVLPVAINALAGAQTPDPRFLRLARSFGSSEWRLFADVIVPSSVPFLLAGLRLAIGRAMIGIVVGELYAAQAGIGRMISEAGANFQTDQVFVGVIVIAISGLGLSAAVRCIERRVEAWRPKVGAAS